MKAMALVVLLSMVLLSTAASANVPGLMNYQGTLTDGSGAALDTTVAMTFSVYTDSTAGIQVWTETQAAVTVSSGVFNVLLGSVNAIEDTVFNGPDRWLGVQVGGDAEMTPRQRIASVGYAFVAGSTAGDGDWTISGDDVYSAVSGNVGIGTATPLEKLHVVGDATLGAVVIVPDEVESGDDAELVLGEDDDATYSVKLRYDGASNQLQILGQEDVTTYGPHMVVKRNSGEVGIGTTNPMARLDVSGDINTDSGYQIDGNTVLAVPDSDNVFVGVGAGENNTGTSVTFVGKEAGYNNQGTQNTFIGRQAGYTNTTGQSNTFIGHGAGAAGTGSNNTFVGKYAGNNTSGSYNTFIGEAAGFQSTSGQRNTFLGRTAGFNNAAGDSNVFIGYGAGYDETGSQKLYIANAADTGHVLLYGDFAAGRVGIGTLDPEAKLDIEGNVEIGGGLVIDATVPAITFDSSGSNAARIHHEGGYDSGYLELEDYSAGWNDVGLVIKENKVGIGTMDPEVALHLDQDVEISSFTGDNDQGLRISGTNTNDRWVLLGFDGGQGKNIAQIGSKQTGGGSYLSFGTSDNYPSGITNEAMTIDYSGKVGIGTTTPAARLDVQGTLSVGEDSSGYDVNFYGGGGLYGGARFFWDEDKMAMRAGRDSDGTHWAPDSVGQYSLATGYNTKASGDYSTAMGYSTTASGYTSTVGGGSYNTASIYEATVGGGSSNTASGSSATVGGGYINTASGNSATVAGGHSNSSHGEYSFTVGYNSYVPSSYSNSAAFNGQMATASGQTRIGAISKVSGTFTIDHPTEPMNRILNHYFVESPEMVLIYRGEAVIGPDGRAEVHLPDYFDALNRNPMVQLTGVGTSDVYVADKVTGNRFVIGGKPGTEVYWTVTGDRKDPSAEITRILMPVEQLKEGDLAGHSLDDDFLATTMSQLERMGQAGKFSFRTQAGREKYEQSRRALENPGQMEPSWRD